jgi:2-polyprenyl-6-methoxyphenol hydroxylase-like FAD-dependent oxidoreductase
MMLAAELTLANVDVAVVERRPGTALEGTRSRGLHARTIEVLDQRGVAERFLREGQAMQVQSFGGIAVGIGDFPSRHNYGLALLQEDFERILHGWIQELGVRVYREVEVTGFTQAPDRVRVELSDADNIEAMYLVGCDGGRSLVRKAAGIAFAGWDPTVSSLIAEAAITDEPEWGIHRDERGQHALGKLDDGKRAGIVVTQPYSGESPAPTLQDLREALISVWGRDFGVHSPTWMSRFTDMTRQAVAYRNARVLLAGDAAHVHYPVGGMGLNIGVQDAVNLGWKLAQVARGVSPDSLLDTYQAERHPVAARVLRITRAATALIRGDDRTNALRETLTEILQMDEPRKMIAGMISGLDIAYDVGGGHPLRGRRMPDLDIETADGPSRVYMFLRGARPVFIKFGRVHGADMAPWADRVPSIDAGYDGPWELPIIGRVAAPKAVLVRPDGHVAWVGERTPDGLEDAMTTWFGAPAQP